MAEDTAAKEDQVPPLNLKPISSKLHPKHSPNMRRHFSQPTINLEKLTLFQDEQKDLEQDDKNTNAINNTFTELMQQDPIEFAEKLQNMTEEIKQQKDLPSKPIIIGLLNVFNKWIQHHGINAINKVTEYVHKYDSITLEHEKHKLILEQTIQEYKNECAQHQERHRSSNNKTAELNNKLNNVTQQLENAAFLQQENVSLKEDLECKSAENERNLNKIINQQKRINELRTQTIKDEKIIDSQKIKLSKMILMENEVKSRGNEVKDINKKYKEMERKYDNIKMEKEGLFKEKKIMQNKLTDYGKLKDNLNQYKLNETVLEEKNMDLKHRNNELMKEMNTLKDACSMSSMESKTNQTMFIGFNDEVHTYNMEGNTTKDIERIFDEEDFKEFNTGNNEVKGDRNGVYRTMYRSFLIVGFSCLCYFVYSQIYYGSSLQKANQIRDKYRKWQRSLNMKRRVVKKPKLAQ